MASFLSTIVGLMASAAVALPAKAAVDPNRYMFFATRARMPSGALVTAALGSNYVCSKIIVNTPQYDTNTFRFHYSGFALTEGGNSPQETVVTGVIGTPGNSTTIDLAFARINGVFYPLKFSAADSAVVVDQTNGIWCDPLVLPKAVRAKSAIEIWTFYHTAVGEKQYPVYRVQKHRGERVWGASDLASLLAFKDNPLTASTPALDANYGIQTQPQYYGPDFMVAKGAWDGRPVVLVPADSIGESRQEFGPAADARGNIGITRRWLDKGYSIPHCIIGVPGAAAFREYTGTGSSIATRRRDIIREIIAFNNGKLPFTTILNQLGFNDAATPYATYTSRYTGEVARLRAEYPGVKIVALVPTGRAGQRTVTLTSVGTLVTATIAETAHLKTGQTLTITNAVPAGYNGNFVIKVTSATTFTYEMPASQTSPATGTITASDWFMTEGNQAYSAPSVFPANAADANTGKWLLRNDIMSKASAFCDDYIDTLDAWQGSAGIGKWPRLEELPSTRLTVATGTDGVATYNQLVVEDGSIFIPEQPLVIFEPDQPRYLSTATVESVDGNTITIKNPIPKIMPVGSRVFQQVSVDGVHPWSAAIRRIVSRIPQTEKSKLVAPPQPALQIIATRGVIPGNENDGPTSVATHTRSDVRLAVKSAPVAAYDIRIKFANWKKTGAALEQNGFNAITVDTGLEISTTNYRGDFDGSVTKSIAATDADQEARVPTLTVLPASTSMFLRASVSVASLGQKWARSIRPAAALDTVVENASTSQSGGTGALVTGGGNARTIGYAPHYIIGRPITPTPGVLVWGDSNDYGFAAVADANGHYGAIQGGLIDANGKPIPHLMECRSGDVFDYCRPSDNPRQSASMKFATHFLGGLVTNSIPTDTVAEMLADVTSTAAFAKATNLRGYAAWRTCLPRTADATNAAVVSGYEPGQKPDQFNTGLIALVGTVLNAVIDLNAGKVYLPGGVVLTSPSGGLKDQSTGKWLSATYTSDGTHLSAAGIAVAIETVKLWAATLV
jgi:hypothetical protein